jgi:ABC-2 type transport system ATP-binding protein
VGSWHYFLALLHLMWHRCHVGNVISIRGLEKSYGSTQAVAGIDLTIAQGEIFALLGPNGAGKTTTVEILEGFRTRDAGEVSVLGTDPAIKGETARVWRNRIGIVLQSTSDAGDLSVHETIAHFAKYYSKPRDVAQVIAAVGLSEKSEELIRTLSGGQRRRLDVALGIIGSPELLFLDEPTTGFDPKARRAFWALIEDLRKTGTTILLTTHYLDEAEALADRVGVISQGQIIEISTPALLGGRATSLATVSWLSSSGPKSEKTDNPTALISKLSSDFSGEIPELTVKRASLEDIYLEMIGGEDE